jgi:rod shape-determining protein MreC
MNRQINIIALVVFVVLVLGILLMSPANVARLQGGFLAVISPFLKSGSDLDRRYKGYWQGLQKLEDLETENARLKTQNDSLKAVNSALRGVEAENIKLREALGYRKQTPFTLISARVVARNTGTWWNWVLLNCGTAEGIEADMPVITPEGLVGKVMQAETHTSRALLISDENCRVSVSIEGTREEGILRGERASSAEQPQVGIRFLSKSADLKPGTKVFTTGKGRVYPPGLYVGEVQQFQVRELNGYAVVKPAVDLASLTDLFVISGMQGERDGAGTAQNPKRP